MPVYRRALVAPVLMPLCLLALSLCGCSNDNRPQELRDAIALGDDDTAYAILENSPELVRSEDVCANTPLHFAAARGNASMAMNLLKGGADASAVDWLGFTPLHWACRAGSIETVTLLIAEKADPTALAQDGWTPLHFAVLSRGSLAPLADRQAIVQKLLDAKVPVNAPAGHWRVTPLHVAVVKGAPSLVALLLAAGADPTLKDLDGKTPLDEARAANRVELVPMLEAPRGQP